MKSTDSSRSIFKRHAVFPLIFTLLFLALLTSSVAVVKQQKTLNTRAAFTFCSPQYGTEVRCGRWSKDKKTCGSVPTFCVWKGNPQYDIGVCEARQRYKDPSKVGVSGYNDYACIGEAVPPPAAPAKACAPQGVCAVDSNYSGCCSGLHPDTDTLCGICTPNGGGGGGGGGGGAPAPAAPGGKTIPDAPGCSSTGCGGCLNGYSSCTAACQGTGNGQVGWCAAPESKDPGRCCACGNSCPAAPVAPTTAPAAPTPTTAAPTTTGTPTPSQSAGDVTLALKLKFQGITKQPVNNSMDVAVSLDADNSETGTFTADSTGAWSGDVSFSGLDLSKKYSVFVKGQKHLQKRVCVSSPTESSGGNYRCSTDGITLASGTNSLNFSNIILLAGDIDQDGVVDSVDISYIRQNLGKAASGALAQVDLNNDGVINTQDYSLAIAALSAKTDDPVN